MKKLFPVILLLIPMLLFAEKTTIGWLGVLSEPVSETMLGTLDLEHGVAITKVYEDSPASKGGIEVGDVIYEIDGEEIVDLATLKLVVADRPNKKVEVKFLRSDKHQKKSITLGEKEKEIIKFNIEIPDIEDFQEKLELGRDEFQKQLEDLKKELETLKKEIEDIKRQLQEQ